MNFVMNSKCETFFSAVAKLISDISYNDCFVVWKQVSKPIWNFKLTNFSTLKLDATLELFQISFAQTGREKGSSRLIESNWPWPGNHLSISKSKWQKNQIRLWSINEIWIALKRTGLLIRSMKFVGLEKRYLTIENAGLVYVALFLCNIIAGEFIRIKTISYSLYGAIIWYYRSI